MHSDDWRWRCRRSAAVPGDQAAGLREWSAAHESGVPSPAAVSTIMVAGYPDSAACSGAVNAVLRHWAASGGRWVGDPASWRVVPVLVSHPGLSTLVAQESRWGLWVSRDSDAFRSAFRTLRTLVAAGGPRRILALHEPTVYRRGLLANLRQAAAEFLGVDLIVLAR